MNNLKFSRSILTIFVGAGLFVAASTPIFALDTDVYLKSQLLSSTNDAAPNVLLILDTSGSMDTVIASNPDYDPSVDYCTADLNTLYPGMLDPNSGKPSGCASTTNRIYWSMSGSPPVTTSTNWFASSKNNCIKSTSLATTGIYGSTKIAMWKSGSNWGSLNGKIDSNMTYVDCQADNTATGNNTADGQANNDGKSPCSSSSTSYSNGSGNCGSGVSLFNWGNFNTNATPTLYTVNYLNYINNALLQSDVTRLSAMKSAAKSIIASNPTLRFGIEVFNRNDSGTRDGGRIISAVDNMDSARITSMQATIDNMVADGNTPLAETLYEAYRYYGGKTVDLGDNDLGASPARDYANSETGGTASTGGTYISPFRYGCQKAYIIYVTDGDPTSDTNADAKIATAIGQSCLGNCLDDLAGWMYSHDVNTTLATTQTVGTFTVGFGGGISGTGLALLNATAAAGGTGNMINATNSAQLSAAIQGAIAKIVADTTAFTAPSLSINAFNKQYNRDDVYLSVFKPSNSCNWDGNLKKYKLCTNADIAANRCSALSDVLDANNVKITDVDNNIVDTAQSIWSSTADGSNVNAGGAGSKMPSPGSRSVYTYMNTYSSMTASTGIAINKTVGNTFRTTVIASPTMAGLPGGSDSVAVDKLIDWILGADSYDKDTDGSTSDARWAFSDPLHSRSVPVTYGGTSATPIVKLFVGANDGSIRMINNTTGAEEWAFLPKEMYSMQYPLAQDADGDHFYGLDNTPSFWVKDINRDGIIDPSAGDRVYMYVSMRRGGRNIYAFDVTPASTLASTSSTFTPKLMWVIEGGTGNFAKLGQTWAAPRIARIRYACSASVCDDSNSSTNDENSRIVLIFGGGYDTNQDNAIPATADSMGNAIYIVNPLTGARIWWASDSSATINSSKMKFGFAGDLTVLDTNGDGFIDRIYAADVGGQIWRADLGTALAQDTSGGSGLYVFADIGCGSGNLHSTSGNCSGSPAEQQRRKFFYSPEVAHIVDNSYSSTPTYDLVAIGTGDREDPLDLLTTELASPASIEAVHNRIYSFRDINVATGAPTTTPTTLTESDLYNATSNLLQTATGAALTTEINNLKAKTGWYMDLHNSTALTVPNGLTTTWIGEKVLSHVTILDKKLYVTTFIPANDSNSTNTCDANAGVATVYILNALTATGAGDFNGDGVANERSSQVGGGIPSEVVIVFRPDGDVGLVNAGGKGAPPTGVDVGGRHVDRKYWYEQ